MTRKSRRKKQKQPAPSSDQVQPVSPLNAVKLDVVATTPGLSLVQDKSTSSDDDPSTCDDCVISSSASSGITDSVALDHDFSCFASGDDENDDSNWTVVQPRPRISRRRGRRAPVVAEVVVRAGSDTTAHRPPSKRVSSPLQTSTAQEPAGPPVSRDDVTSQPAAPPCPPPTSAPLPSPRNYAVPNQDFVPSWMLPHSAPVFYEPVLVFVPALGCYAPCNVVGGWFQ